MTDKSGSSCQEADSVPSGDPRSRLRIASFCTPYEEALDSRDRVVVSIWSKGFDGNFLLFSSKCTEED